MENLMTITYERSDNKKTTNDLGMREMQAKAFEKRQAQYLLLKSPPASGKSRALMFLALDKLYNQGIKKVIVAVPEQSIGSSFNSTDLTTYGFYYDWEVNPHYNLCNNTSNQSKVAVFKEFLDNDEKILICPHATLRNTYNEVDAQKFENCLVAIDEFHHVSADADSKLGELLRQVMDKTNAHIIAMTGSYFRGDSNPVLRPEDEEKFVKVTYDYYQQMKNYKYLKSIGIGYHFYQGKYYDSLAEVLDLNKKTIIHIPSVNSRESTKDKYGEVGFILDKMGKFLKQDEHGIYHVQTASGKVLKVADLVEEQKRDVVMDYVKSVKNEDDLDMIIALGMAKEGFDWPFCEHALTIGYRGSMTEIVQIIGRCTRDSSNKTHAQFTNLLAEPDVEDTEVKYAVNNMLKAISASLLMEQVLAPKLNFKLKGENLPEGTIKVGGLKEPSSPRTKEIVENDMVELTAKILDDPKVQNLIASTESDEQKAVVLNKALIPRVIAMVYPDLSTEQVEEVRQQMTLNAVLKNAEVVEGKSSSGEDTRFLRFATKLHNIDDLHIDLIDRVNPFMEAYEILSKNFTEGVLKAIRDAIDSKGIELTLEEAVELYPLIGEFKKQHNRLPDIKSSHMDERRLAEAILVIKKARRQAGATS